MRASRRRLAFIGGFVAICGLAAAGLSGAVGTEANHTYHGCYQSNGNIYLIDETDLRSSCRNNDTEFTFSLRGPVGPPGADGVSVTSTQLQPGNANCPTGGTRLVSSNATTFVCNGAKGDTGANGADGISVQASQLGSGDSNCANGGVRLVAASSTTYVCNGAQGQQGPPGSPAAAATPDRYAGGYSLYVDNQFAGPVELVDGCAVSAPVITFQQGNSNLVFKTIGNPKPEPCTMHVGFNMSGPFWQWLEQTFSGTPTPHDGKIVRIDAAGDPISGIAFFGALPAELDLPAVQLGSSDGYDLTFILTPEDLRNATTLPGPLPASQTQIEQFQPSLTDVTIANVGGDPPSSIDPLAITQTITEFSAGQERDYGILAGRLNVPNLGFHYDQANGTAVSDLKSWYTSFVIQGNSGSSDERTTTLTLGGHHAGNAFDNLVVLTFGHTGIYRFDPYERQSDSAYRANLYAETVSLDAHNSS